MGIPEKPVHIKRKVKIEGNKGGSIKEGDRPHRGSASAANPLHSFILHAIFF
jgi:hypothetical protein